MTDTENTSKPPTSEKPRKLLFIVNPNAGKKIKRDITQIIKGDFPAGVPFEIVLWEDKNNFEKITGLLGTGNYTDAIAVGGDGTVNQVAKTVANTTIRLGIVPIGSGNGLARSLSLSMNINEVFKQIAEGRTAKIDKGEVNGIPFFCTSGMGFDAHIGNLFATSKKRGLQSYIRITTMELFRYRAKNYTLLFEGKELKRKAFLITVANAGQYGNDFYIAPEANMQDGKFHVVILKPFNAFQVIGLLVKIIGRKAHHSRVIETFVTSKITIVREARDVIHLDGEPALAGKDLVFENSRQALNVIVGEKHKAV